MEQSSSLFSLSIDPVTKAHLSETAKWARFLAIVGMVLLVLGVIGIIIFATTMSSFTGSMDNPYGRAGSFPPFFGVGIAAFYILIMALWFFPLMFLLRFANRMRVALNGNDQQALNTSFQHLKICFRFVGIVTIIVLALYAIGIAFALISAAAFLR
ncbi:MAG: hypothetical protein ICV51_08135 [Flavisolibacter sp.]|nr:hypothetical protein [Flavisolibacter sp.]MBD0285855.1 hypothetical protein [Flavisolibacter sp.]MBD0296845.1 hypothetical protein [Flavisolibacter sp.]MBD0366781.1 hypothetical protein [Flavisolibacter sp.]MBD0375579.1 hypothetical protein [Flavisolibacter sp.]